MSTKKEAERSSTEYDLKRELRTGLSEQNNAVDRVLNETKENITITIDEARRNIPRNTQAINDYQEHTLQASREIAESYLESQKEIIQSFQSTCVPYIENIYNASRNNWAAEIYARTVSNFTDTMMAASRIANNTLFANIGAYKTLAQREKDVKEFSRMAANTARTFENTSMEFAK